MTHYIKYTKGKYARLVHTSQLMISFDLWHIHQDILPLSPLLITVQVYFTSELHSRLYLQCIYNEQITTEDLHRHLSE